MALAGLFEKEDGNMAEGDSMEGSECKCGVEAHEAGTGCCAAPVEMDHRMRILDAALSLFAEKGYAATSVRELVGAAGVTAPVLYYYFRNKEGLYLAIMNAALTRFKETVAGTVSEDASSRERILRLANGMSELCRSEIRITKILYAVFYGPQQGAPAFNFSEFHETMLNAVRKLVDDGVRSGEFGPGDEECSVWALLGAIHLAVESEFCLPEDGLKPRSFDGVFDVILRGMAARG